MIQSAWLRVPQPLHFGIRFELGTIVTVSFLCLAGLLELLGDQTTAANLAENRLPTGKEQHGGILAQGISSVFGSLFNLCPTISISANLGLCGLTGVTSRFVIAITRRAGPCSAASARKSAPSSPLSPTRCSAAWR